MIVYLLLGITTGIIFAIIFMKFFLPLIEINQEVYTYKKTDTATYWNLNTQKQAVIVQREFPELKETQEEQTNAIGFHMGNVEEEDDYDCEDKKNKIGFRKH